MKILTTTIAAIVLALTFIALQPTSASGADFTISASRSKAIPGQWITLKGRVPSHKAQNLEIVRTLYGGVVGTGRSDSRGYFNLRTRMPSMPKEGFAIRVVGGGTSKKVSVIAVRQEAILQESGGQLRASSVPAMPRTFVLQKRKTASRWVTVSRKHSKSGSVGFSYSRGATYRVIAEKVNDVQAIASIPVVTGSVKLQNTRSNTTASPTVYKVQPDSWNAAAAKLGWYPAARTWDWIYGEDEAKWTSYSEGTGASLMTLGGRWQFSGPNGNDMHFGSVVTTSKERGSKFGQWEFRGRQVERENNHHSYRMRYSLVPEGSKDGVRPNQEITVASVEGRSNSFLIGVRDGNREYVSTVRGWAHNGTNWHVYSVQVNSKRISWLVNGEAVASMARPAKLAGSWVPRLALEAPTKTRMNSTTLGTDWIRFFPLQDQVNAKESDFKTTPLRAEVEKVLSQNEEAPAAPKEQLNISIGVRASARAMALKEQ